MSYGSHAKLSSSLGNYFSVELDRFINTVDGPTTVNVMEGETYEFDCDSCPVSSEMLFNNYCVSKGYPLFPEPGLRLILSSKE